MQVDWNGVYPAVTTKFNKDESIDFENFERGIEAQINAGVDGIIVAGSLGEQSTLTADEKKDIAKSALNVSAGRVPVILNVAEARTSVAIQTVKEAEKAGLDGIMILPPMKYKSGDHETVEYFKAVASSSGLPFMIYNNPVDYKIFVSVDMFKELAKLENITAVKESTRDITNITRMKNAFGDRFKISCGVDTLALECLAAGADGWVAGLVNAFPRETVVIYKLMKAGRTEEALKIYRWFMPLLELDIHPKLVQYIKLAEVATDLGTEFTRAPRLPLIGEERDRIWRIIYEGVSLRPDMSVYADL